MKQQFALLLLMPILACTAVPAHAANDPITVTETFQSQSDKEADWANAYSAAERMEQDGKEYSLADTEFRVIDSEDNAPNTFVIPEENLPSQSYTAPTVAQNPDDNTQAGMLQDIEYEAQTVSGRTAEADGQRTYKDQLRVPSVPDELTITETDAATGETVSAAIPLDRVEEQGFAWKSGFSFAGTVVGVDAGAYSFPNGGVIPNTGDQPVYEGYESVILDYLGLPAASYRITGSEWVGDSYTNENGDLCRDVCYYADCYVSDYIAYYQGEIELPDLQLYTANAIYRAAGDVSTTYTVEAVSTYTQTNTISTAAAVTAGILVLAVLSAAVLFILSKKRRENNDVS